jgi:hypothetical protein
MYPFEKPGEISEVCVEQENALDSNFGNFLPQNIEMIHSYFVIRNIKKPIRVTMRRTVCNYSQVGGNFLHCVRSYNGLISPRVYASVQEFAKIPSCQISQVC